MVALVTNKHNLFCIITIDYIQILNCHDVAVDYKRYGFSSCFFLILINIHVLKRKSNYLFKTTMKTYFFFNHNAQTSKYFLDEIDSVMYIILRSLQVTHFTCLLCFKKITENIENLPDKSLS